jgi:hypothetical protein
LGATVLTPAISHVLQHRKDWRGIALAVLGSVLMVAAFVWPWLQTILGEGLVTSISRTVSDFRIWLALIVMAFLYGAASSIISALKRDRMAEVIERDIIPLRLAMERFVLPRRLSANEIEQIGRYLAGFRPYVINFVVNEGDEEAGSYRADIQRALAAGGWNVGRIEYRGGLQAGLTYQYSYTRETEARRNDPREKVPDQLLVEAMQEAQIAFDGGGGGGGAATDSITISVGARRRDAHGRPQRW